MGLAAESPLPVFYDVFNRKLGRIFVPPARLQEILDVLSLLCGYRFCKNQVVLIVNDYFQLIAAVKQGLLWALMSLRRECDPVEATS